MVLPETHSMILQANSSEKYDNSDVISAINSTFFSSSVSPVTAVRILTSQSVPTTALVRWWTILFIVISTLLGNALTLAAIATTQKLRIKTYALVTSLAVADVLFALVGINYLIHDFWTFTACRTSLYKSIVRPFERLTQYASFLHIAIIAFDRYVAISHPLTYETRMTSQTYRNLIIGVWVFAAAISLPPYLSFFGVSPPDVKQSPTPCILTLWPVSEAFLELTVYAFNSLTVVLVYVKVWLTALHHGKKQMDLQFQQLPTVSASVAGDDATKGSTAKTATSSRTVPSGHEPSLEANGKKKQSTATSGPVTKWASYRKMISKHRATRTVFALLTLYVVMWFPYVLSRVLVAFDWPQGVTMWMYSGIIGSSNMSINVIVYAVTNRDFRAAFKRILHIGINVVQVDSFVSK